MHPFFRPKRAMAAAPDSTPYQRAGQIWDDRMGLTLAHADEISAFEARRESWRPATLPAKHLPSVEIVAARPAGVPVEIGRRP